MATKKTKTKKMSEMTEPKEEEIIQAATENKVTIEAVKEALDKVEITDELSEELTKNLEEKIQEKLAPTQQALDVLNEINTSMENVNTIVANNPEKAREALLLEKRKMEELEQQIRKMKAQFNSKSNFTNIWNGTYND